MSQIHLPGYITSIPSFPANSGTVGASSTLNGTGETCFFVGSIILENPLGGSKTISSAGGGSIIWRNSNADISAGSNFKIGIQDVSTASSPAQGDGTFDVEASFTTTGVTHNAVNTSVMTSGTKTIANGDMVAIGFQMTTRVAPDTVSIVAAHGVAFGVSPVFPAVVDNTGGTYARLTTAYPNAYIKFDDGSIGWIFGTSFTNTTTAQTYASNTGTADEYGNLFFLPHTFVALGASIACSVSSNAADYEILLYTDPLGTPAVARTITVDATQVSATGNSSASQYAFSTPYVIKAYTPYALTVRPTTTTSLSCYYIDPATADASDTCGVGTNFYSVRRLDNTGAFSDYNGGTAKTRIMLMRLLGSSMEQGINNANYRIGI